MLGVGKVAFSYISEKRANSEGLRAQERKKRIDRQEQPRGGRKNVERKFTSSYC